jgi:hypothetical protein
MAVMPFEFMTYPAQFLEVCWLDAVFTVANTRDETKKRRRIFRTMRGFKGETELGEGSVGV